MSSSLGKSTNAYAENQPLGASKSKHLQSVSSIIDDYIANFQYKLQLEREYWADHVNLKNAIRAAAMSEYPLGKRHRHQRRFKKVTLELTAERLCDASLPIDGTFDQLHEAVRAAISCIHGVGDLAVYDIANRIGCYLRVQPDRVYLHAGARDGARAFELNSGSIQKSELPSEFERLSCAEIEDCLCVYKDCFKRLASTLHRQSAI